MKKRKYGLGGKHFKSPQETLAQSSIDSGKAQSAGASNDFANILGLIGSFAASNSKGIAGSIMPGDTAAFGGTIEVEGNEVAETPNGNLLDFMGPSHEAGGIDVNLPDGTDIFSKRILVDGKTMADRKKARVSKLEKMQKLFDNSKADKAIETSYNRTKDNFDKEEASDLSIQRLMDMMLGNPDAPEKAAFGKTGILGNPKFLDFINGGDEENVMPDVPGMDLTDFVSGTDAGYDNPLSLQVGDESFGTEMPPLATPPVADDSSGLDGFLGEITGGDAIALGGNLISAFGPLNNVLKNRATDTPNVNSFKDFGKDAIESNTLSQEFAADQKVNADNKIQLGKNAQIKRGRSGSRSINTARALDLASELQSNLGQNRADDAFSSQMMQLLSQRAGLENEQDRIVMGGEAQRDDADRRDKDNFYTQKGAAISNLGTGIQQAGKNVNDIKEREIIKTLLGQLSKYGITLDKNFEKTVQAK